MLNQTVLVGRLTSDPEINEVDGVKVCNITIAVPRSFKNVNGEYDTDFIPVKLHRGIAENTAEYCKKGDLVGVKGRIEIDTDTIKVVAERVTFLSSKRDE